MANKPTNIITTGAVTDASSNLVCFYYSGDCTSTRTGNGMSLAYSNDGKHKNNVIYNGDTYYLLNCNVWRSSYNSINGKVSAGELMIVHQSPITKAYLHIFVPITLGESSDFDTLLTPTQAVPKIISPNFNSLFSFIPNSPFYSITNWSTMCIFDKSNIHMTLDEFNNIPIAVAGAVVNYGGAVTQFLNPMIDGTSYSYTASNTSVNSTSVMNNLQNNSANTAKIAKNLINNPWVEFGTLLILELFYLSVGIILLSSTALYTSLVADAGGMTVEELSASNIGKPDEIAHIVNVFEGYFPPKMVTKHETHIRFDASSHDYISEQFREMFPTNIPLGYFLFSVIKSVINTDYLISMGVHRALYKLPESMTFCLALWILPIMYIIIYFINIPLAMGYHLYHFKKYFISCLKDPLNPTNPCTEKEDYGIVSWVCLYFYGMFGFLLSTLFFIPVFSVLYCYITPLLVNSKLTKGDTPNYSFLPFIVNVLSYKRQLIMWLISIMLVKITYISFGAYNAGGCLAAIAFLAIFTGVYSKYIPECASL